jgi:hypothetical protein
MMDSTFGLISAPPVPFLARLSLRGHPLPTVGVVAGGVADARRSVHENGPVECYPFQTLDISTRPYRVPTSLDDKFAGRRSPVTGRTLAEVIRRSK